MVDFSDWVKKDSLLSLLSQADKTKQDLLKILAKEFRSFLENMLEDSTLDIHARIKLVPADKKGLKIEVVSQETQIKKPSKTNKTKTKKPTSKPRAQKKDK